MCPKMTLTSLLLNKRTKIRRKRPCMTITLSLACAAWRFRQLSVSVQSGEAHENERRSCLSPRLLAARGLFLQLCRFASALKPPSYAGYIVIKYIREVRKEDRELEEILPEELNRFLSEFIIAARTKEDE